MNTPGFNSRTGTSDTKPLLVGLNPSPRSDKAWFEGANTTGALAYLAFDYAQNPTVCQSGFDLRNLNARIVDREHISRVDPVEAMTRLSTWNDEGSLKGPVVACGRTTALMIQAFVAARGLKGVKLYEIPHPACLWRTSSRVPVKRWIEARIRLREALGMPALVQVDEYGITNAFDAFGGYVDYLEMKGIQEEDAAFQAASDLDDEDWDEEEEYWRTLQIENDDEQNEHIENADRLREEGRYYD